MITMLTIVQDFQKRCGVNGADRGRLLMLVAAHAAASAHPCPGNEADGDTFYREYAQAQISRWLSAVNEVCVFDVSGAAKLARALWIERFYLTNGVLEVDAFLELKKSIVGAEGQQDLSWPFENWSQNFRVAFSSTLLEK